MAKFCANCGAPMDDEDRVCGQCGTPVESASAEEPANQQGTATQATAKGNKSGNIVKIAIAAVAAVVVLTVGVNVAGNFTGYKGTLNKMTTALQKNDTATLEGLASSISDETVSEYYGEKSLYTQYDNLISNTLDKYEEKVGNIKKISYEITDSTEMSDRRLQNTLDSLTDAYNMDTSDIKKIVEVECKITVKGANKKSASYNAVNLYMVKEKGGWKIVYPNLAGSF